MRALLKASAALAFLLLLPSAHAQFTDLLKKTQPAASDNKPADPLGRSTPRGTVMGFLREAQLGRYDLAAQYLQLSEAEREGKRGAELARELHFVMDFAFAGDLDHISDIPQGTPDVRFPPDREMAGSLRSDTAVQRLMLTRVDDKEFGRIWIVSSDTLAHVPELYGEIGFPAVESKLPAALVERRFLSIPIWRWLAAVIALPVCFVAAWILLQFFLLPIRWRRQQAFAAETSTPLLVIVTMLLHYIAVATLRIPLLLRQYYTRVVWISLTLGFGWLVWRWLRMGIDHAYDAALQRGAASAGSLIRLTRRLLKIALVLALIFVCLGILGIHLTPALAGLGIGGLALAFAAQKTLENVFAGVSLLSDETIRVGDFCQVGTQKGTVEDIGLRSTTLRTLDRTLLSVPNGTLATMTIENFAYRDKIFFNPTLTLRCETTAAQMKTTLDGIRKMMVDDPRIETEGSRASFIRMSTSSLDIEVFCYVLTRDWTEFCAIREELLLRIIEIVERAGTGFAFPSQTLYIASPADSGRGSRI